MVDNVIIFGDGPLAVTAYYLAQDIPSLKIKAFLVDDEYYGNDILCGLPVLESSQLYKDKSISVNNKFILCVGYKKLRNRKKIFDKLLSTGCEFTNLIHPTSFIMNNVKMGINNIVSPYVIIEHSATIGNNNYLWTRTLVGHNVVIGDHNYFSEGVGIGGNSVVKDLCFFGNRAYTINDLFVDDETFLVAGSGLFKDTEPHMKYFGHPARIVGHHEEDGIVNS